ncbi:hypothetical protein BIY22_12215 [Vibrio panuliri]|uniref:Uncharacterized protein n=1 Tax=Vibrio panuliri TaxID=1381081 RepID=A0A1Q9HBA3_9VIBR|nr:hypothetical protein BIY22_12215 [Vibrio panuliri]
MQLHSKTKYEIGYIAATYAGLKTGKLIALAVYRTYPTQATQTNLTIKGFLGVSITLSNSKMDRNALPTLTISTKFA